MQEATCEMLSSSHKTRTCDPHLSKVLHPLKLPLHIFLPNRLFRLAQRPNKVPKRNFWHRQLGIQRYLRPSHLKRVRIRRRTRHDVLGDSGGVFSGGPHDVLEVGGVLDFADGFEEGVADDGGYVRA